MSNSQKSFINQPKSFIGARPLLFDRLVDQSTNDSFEFTNQNLLTIPEIKDSVISEISKLLNTRLNSMDANFFLEEDESYKGSAFYGLPDLAIYQVSSMQEWPAIENTIKKTILSFEPRVSDVSVSILQFDNQTQSLHVKIEAKLNVKKVSETLTFSVAIECGIDK